jgi:hypothetical protein
MNPIDLRPREGYAASDAKTARQTAPAWRLAAEAAGRPRHWAAKSCRALRTAALYADLPEVRRRLRRLVELGYIDAPPTSLQLAFASMDMLRYFIVPGARDYYATRGIDFRFHQLLRFLEDPVSVIDPIGILSDRDTIIGHLLQVVHANPVYDLQLLAIFEGGLEELRRQAQAMVLGSHPRAATVGAVIEDPEYHGRLLAFLDAWRADPSTPSLLRRDGGIREDPSFVLAEATFGTLPSFLRYARRLPRDLASLVRHRKREAAVNPRYCDPEVVAAHRALFS